MTNPALTATQINVLRHATDWPKRYRNHFVTGPGSKDYDDCEVLVAAGLMTKRGVPWVPDWIYSVTDAGVAFLEELQK